MKIEGRVFKGHLLLQIATVQRNDIGRSLTEELEACLVDLCHQMEVPIPLWLKKNTREFARFHQTIFFDGQFTEDIKFDRFQIKWLEDDNEGEI
ncbi:MAG: hypothetical protein GX028_09465 [Clostridiaceae bacterium]|jgi:hypothetical protein|nr:hypothetical protein [Clostridiaceae bacterium]